MVFKCSIIHHRTFQLLTQTQLTLSLIYLSVLLFIQQVNNIRASSTNLLLPFQLFTLSCISVEWVYRGIIMSMSLQCQIYIDSNICMCYRVKVMMLRFVVLLTLSVALAECRVSVLTYHRQYYVNNNVLNCSELNGYNLCANQCGALFVKICDVNGGNACMICQV